jgi:hypothetical protein
MSLSPESLPLLQPEASAFTRPMFSHMRTLVYGTLLASGRRTVAAALRAIGRGVECQRFRPRCITKESYPQESLASRNILPYASISKKTRESEGPRPEAWSRGWLMVSAKHASSTSRGGMERGEARGREQLHHNAWVSSSRLSFRGLPPWPARVRLEPRAVH